MRPNELPIFVILIAWSVALRVIEAGGIYNQGHKPRVPGKPRPFHIENALLPLTKEKLPDEWLWNNVSGVNYLTVMRNQHIPQYCGSCWAFAATSALSDRIKIARSAKWPDIVISTQVIISCAVDAGDGCHGGDAGEAYAWMSKNDITDETCSIYQAKGHDNGLPCGNI